MRFLVLFFSLFLPLASWAAGPQFNQGVEALSQKNYPQAVSLFQEALKQEPNNLTAWHNLAVSHLAQKDDLKAYAYWRKALVLDPGFRPAKDGLSYLMKTSKISQIPNSSTLERIGLSQLLILVFLVTFASSLLLIRFLKRRKEEKTASLSVLTLALLFWGTLCCFTAVKAFSELSVKAIVLADTQARSAPTESGAGLFTLKGGEEAEILAKDENWLQVSSGTMVGWVPKQAVLVLNRSGFND